MSTTGWIVIGVIVVLVIFVISIYNGLVTLRQRVNQDMPAFQVLHATREEQIEAIGIGGSRTDNATFKYFNLTSRGLQKLCVRWLHVVGKVVSTPRR